MAGPWIPMQTNLIREREVIAIAGLTGLDEWAVVGRLHAIWSWADSVSRDGHALGVTLTWLDRYIGHEGFADAMVTVGWLTITREGKLPGISIPNWERWFSRNAKTRLLASDRKRRERSRTGHADVTPESRKQRDKNVTTEQNRTEQIKKKRLSGAAAPAPAETWLTPLLAAWQEELGGKPPNGQLARYCRPLVDAHGPDATVAQLRAYLRLHTGDRATYLDLSKFAGAFGQWGHAAGSVVSAAEEARIEGVLSLVRRKDVHP